jgi:transposase
MHVNCGVGLVRVLLYVVGMDALLELPDDPALLKQMLIERDTLIVQRDTIIIEREALLAQREAQLEQVKREAADQIEALRLKHQAEVAAILRRFYGPRNERFDPTQLLLFGQRVDEMPLDEASITEEAGEPLTTRRPRNRHKHGRGKLPEHLPRIRIEHDLPAEQKPCPCCGGARHRIGEEVSEQLEYIPASFKVLQHVRFKYACRHCEQHGTSTPIDIADKPAQPIEKGLCGPGLLAYIITSKLGDHLPLYRLEHIFKRSGVNISRSTMCAWLDAAAQLVTPLVERMTQRVRQSKVIHTDETRVPIQAPGEGKCRSGRIWTYIGDPRNPYIVYDYTPDRTRAGPSNWLASFRGYLQADAYGGYDGIYCKGDVIEVACWAHARRKFFDAKETDARRAAEMLCMVRELYAVEDAAKALGNDERRALRQQQAAPVLARIRIWLDTELQLVLPRSPMAAAITYTLNQWDALNRYVEQGYLNIDNNAAERSLKRVAVGRKNWLFAGNDHFGSVAATLYSLIASAERHGVDPQHYLTSVLANIAVTPVSELGRFLPEVWKAENQNELPPHPITPSSLSAYG